jgi:hypothetical protein
MAFSIPNEADAFNANQAEPDKVDIDILVAGYAGSGVVSGCAVTAQGSPDMTVAVAVGVVRVAGANAAVTAGNVTIGTADATNPRIDLITVNNSGTKACTAGTAAAEPVFPAIPASSVVLAAVYVPANDTTIASNQIVDKRVILDGWLSSMVANNQTGTTYTLVLGDAGYVIECNNASAITLTVPTNASVAFPIGTRIDVYQMGAGQVTISSSATLRAPNGAKTAGQYSVLSLWKRATDEWVISGDTVP